jgi:hypothetical protein
MSSSSFFFSLHTFQPHKLLLFPSSQDISSIASYRFPGTQTLSSIPPLICHNDLTLLVIHLCACLFVFVMVIVAVIVVVVVVGREMGGRREGEYMNCISIFRYLPACLSVCIPLPLSLCVYMYAHPTLSVYTALLHSLKFTHTHSVSLSACLSSW